MRAPTSWLSPYRKLAAALLEAAEAILARPRPVAASMGSLLAATVAAWFLYVPVHELLHALGCLAAGGRVEELQIAPIYGGRLLQAIVPFVRAGGEHAGRLAKFDTGGSDLVYLATDLTPYVLSVVGAFPLLRRARERRSALWFGPGAVLGAAPLISLPGDYFEMAGILVSRTLRGLGVGRSSACADALRSDDLIALLADFPSLFPDRRAAWGLAVLATLGVAFLLAGVTLAAAAWCDRRRTAAGAGG